MMIYYYYKYLQITVRSMQSHNSSYSVESRMPNLPKTHCAFHSSEPITNFCTCESCLLPLCPSCIKIHTLEHINLKKINPCYESITDLMEQIYEQVQQFSEKYNQNYQKIVQIDARVCSFKTAMQQKIFMVKNDIIGELQKNFAKLAQETESSINNMNYVKLLTKYKEQSKKIIIGLKNVERSFVPDNKKIMRTIIKYKGGSFKKQLQAFNEGIQTFFKEVNSNFATFSVREDFKQALNEYLQGIKKIEIHDVKGLPQVPELSTKLKEVYEKVDLDQKGKKQIKNSIGHLLNNSSSRLDKQSEDCSSNYNSVSKLENTENIQFFRHDSTDKCVEKKRSVSKGKGLSVMQVNGLLHSNLKKAYGKAVNISQPSDFNRTTFIRRPGY